METNRTTSRRALALIQIWASEALLPLSHVASSLSRLTPVSRHCRVAPTERAWKVLLPWGRALRSHGALLEQVYYMEHAMSSVLAWQAGSPSADGGLFIPRMNDRGFQARSG